MNKKKLRIVFLGTPKFAVTVLDKLISAGGHEVCAAVTQTDKPGNRGEILYSPVKEYALNREIKVLQYGSIKKEGVDELKRLRPDLMITAAYGQILSQEILDAAPLGVLNVHASLLPAYRGAAPVQWAIIKGEKVTGVTVMQTDIGMDTGDIVLQKEYKIPDGANAGQVLDDLALLGGEALTDVLKNRPWKRTPQDHAAATKYPILEKRHGKIDWRARAEDIVNLVRGVSEWPVAFTVWNDLPLKIHKAEVFTVKNGEFNNTLQGVVLYSDAKNGIIAACGDGAVRILELQKAGGRRMTAKEFLAGRAIPIGTRFN